MMLSDKNISEALSTGLLKIDPFPDLIQPASVDIHLSDSFCVNGSPVTSGNSFWMFPGDFILGSTIESVTLPTELSARFEGKSSLGRKGLLTHVSAGFIDPGFSGQITLEMVNLSNEAIVLYPGMPIGQLCFFRLESPSTHPYGHSSYGSHYQGQTGATPSAV